MTTIGRQLYIQDIMNQNNNINIPKAILPLFRAEKRRRVAYIASAAAFMLMFFFLSPLDLYLNNSGEFLIEVTTVIVLLAVACIAISLVFLFILPLIFRGKALDVLTLILCGLSVSSYAQALFMNGNMTLFIGLTPAYSEYGASNIINFLIWVFLAVLPLCIWKGLQDSERLRGVKWETGVICVSIVIIGMQTVGIIAVTPDYENERYEFPSYYFSYSEAFELSQDENICVFVIDSLDVTWMNEAFERYPEIKEHLDGFTFYQNNTSVFPATYPTTVNLFTQKLHDALPPVDYEEAWREPVLTDVLRVNGYSVSLLPDVMTTLGDAGYDVYERFDNTIPHDAQVVINYYTVLETLLNLSFGRNAPYLFKNNFLYIVDRRDDNFGIGFNSHFLTDDVFPYEVRNSTDALFYYRLKDVGLRLQNETKVFSYAHFNSGHNFNGFSYNDNTGRFEYTRGNDHIDSVRGSFVILGEYFSQMKELGVYDNSTIILIADHGSILITSPLSRPVVSSLLIKPKNSRGLLQTDAASELSHENFQASILDIAGLPYSEDYGPSYFDIIESSLPRKRVFYDNYVTRYEITGDANDFENWVMLDDAG